MTGLSLMERFQQRGVDMLLLAASDASGLTPGQVLGRDRHRGRIEARRALYRALRVRGLSYPAIGYLVGRAHTTVMNALREKE